MTALRIMGYIVKLKIISAERQFGECFHAVAMIILKNFIMLNVVILTTNILIVAMLRVILLNVVMVSSLHYSECRYADFRGTSISTAI